MQNTESRRGDWKLDVIVLASPSFMDGWVSVELFVPSLPDKLWQCGDLLDIADEATIALHRQNRSNIAAEIKRVEDIATNTEYRT